MVRGEFRFLIFFRRECGDKSYEILPGGVSTTRPNGRLSTFKDSNTSDDEREVRFSKLDFRSPRPSADLMTPVALPLPLPPRPIDQHQKQTAVWNVRRSLCTSNGVSNAVFTRYDFIVILHQSFPLHNIHRMHFFVGLGNSHECLRVSGH